MTRPRWSNEHPQKLCIGERTIVIPPHTILSPSLLVVQTHPVLAKPSPLAALQVDHLLARPSPARPQISKQPSHPIAPRGDHDPQAEQLLPLVRRAAELPRRQIRPGRIHRRAGLLAARSSRRDSPGERRELRSARARALAVLKDCDLELLLRMRDFDRVRLVWRRV
jgi:hypothetical protein